MTRLPAIVRSLFERHSEAAGKLAFIATLFGCMFLGVFAYRMSELPWSLGLGLSQYDKCRRWLPQMGRAVPHRSGWRFVLVRGRGREVSGESSVKPVLYDSANPRSCRLAKNVQRPSNYELGMLMPGWLGIGYVMLYLASRRAA